jgi:hypothetical protein
MNHKTMKTKNQFGLKGHYHIVTLPAHPGASAKERIRAYHAGEVQAVKISPEVDNLLVLSDTYGLDLILRALMGGTEYPLDINYASIGTGTTPVTEADTGMEVETLGGIERATSEIVDGELLLEYFITNNELANGNYSELGLFCGNQLFAHSIIDPAYTKGSFQDTLIQYTIGIGNLGLA